MIASAPTKAHQSSSLRRPDSEPLRSMTEEVVAAVGDGLPSESAINWMALFSWDVRVSARGRITRVLVDGMAHFGGTASAIAFAALATFLCISWEALSEAWAAATRFSSCSPSLKRTSNCFRTPQKKVIFSSKNFSQVILSTQVHSRKSILPKNPGRRAWSYD